MKQGSSSAGCRDNAPGGAGLSLAAPRFAAAGRLLAAFLLLPAALLAAKLLFSPPPSRAFAAAPAALPLLAAALAAAAFAVCFAALRQSRRLRRQAGRALAALGQMRRQLEEMQRQSAVLPPAEGDAPARLKAAKALLDAAQAPLWLRDGTSGKVLFANAACKRLAGAHGGGEADIAALLPPAQRRAFAAARQNKQNFSARAKLVLKGERHIFICRSVYSPQEDCFLESAEDISEQQALRENAARIKEGYAETFDRLATSVAIFTPDMKLEFFNSAFAALWPLETAFLESAPSHALLLDRLREKGILNERPDWREWKEELFAAYRSPEPQHYIWNLPDGRTLRVVANPHPQGGVTWLFDDLTENLALQARYDTLIKIQGETLDNLSEGVAVFGANGRLRLSNPAFAALWNLPPHLVIEETHIEHIKSFCQKAGAAAPPPPAPAESAAAGWDKIALFITAFADKRDITQSRLTLAGGAVYDYMLAPLPQGQTLLTFVNVTDSVNIARALHERNAALESADRLRSAFIRHVSYELRTPLTNIMGFTDLLGAHIYGGLNAKQSESVQNISAQSRILLNLVNDVLSLATIDAGGMELRLGEVSAAAAMAAAAARARPQLAAKNLTLETDSGGAAASVFEADETRLQQIFAHLLKNAAQAAPENSRIRFAAERCGHYLAFSVEDEGKGIPPERRAEIFKPFTAYASAGQKTGAGLGLALVKSFVELHQGHVEAAEGARGGAKFICRFPFRARAQTGGGQGEAAAQAAAGQSGRAESGETESGAGLH